MPCRGPWRRSQPASQERYGLANDARIQRYTPHSHQGDTDQSSYNTDCSDRSEGHPTAFIPSDHEGRVEHVAIGASGPEYARSQAAHQAATDCKQKAGENKHSTVSPIAHRVVLTPFMDRSSSPPQGAVRQVNRSRDRSREVRPVPFVAVGAESSGLCRRGSQAKPLESLRPGQLAPALQRVPRGARLVVVLATAAAFVTCVTWRARRGDKSGRRRSRGGGGGRSRCCRGRGSCRRTREGPQCHIHLNDRIQYGVGS